MWFPIVLCFSNFKSLTEKHIESFKKVPQFYYIGKEDNNDPFEAKIENGKIYPANPSIISTDEIKQLCKYVGIDIKTRVPKIMELYKKLGVNVTFKIYDQKDHHSCLDFAPKDISSFIDGNLEKTQNLVK